MKQYLFAFCQKHREALSYLFFGGLTTLVNYVTYLLLARLIPGSAQVALATAAAWLVAVLFAYGTNRRWVFRSKAAGFAAVAAELGRFFAARILSGVLDLGIMVAMVDWMGYPDWIVKLLANILVIVLNYFASKLWIFSEKN